MSNLLQNTMESIRPIDQEAAAYARRRWDATARPLHSLGIWEDFIIQIAGAQHTPNVQLQKKVLVTFCADNGVVEENVSQSDHSVTTIVAENFLKKQATAALFCQQTNTEHIVVDIGMIDDISISGKYKIANGTRNMRKGPAMTREEAICALEVGISVANENIDADIFAIGEMGIGNTTTGSALAAVLLGKDPAEVTGRGAGLDDARLRNKIKVIQESITINQPNRDDPIDVLAKVGGFDIAGMAGLILGAAAMGVPVVNDGFISSVAALVAIRICPEVAGYIIPSHISKEPAANMLMEALGKEAPMHCNMFPGEGAGAVMLFPMLEMALKIYKEMPRFEEVDIEAYVPLGG